MIDAVRAAVLVDVAYEVGGAGLAGFPKMLAACRAGAWATAAAELKDSLLFSQVQEREQRNVIILALGEFPAGVASGRELTKLNEGLILVARPDADGMWEYGYGHDVPAPAPGAAVPTCTPDEAEAMFEADYALAESRAEADLGSEYWMGGST